MLIHSFLTLGSAVLVAAQGGRGGGGFGGGRGGGGGGGGRGGGGGGGGFGGGGFGGGGNGGGRPGGGGGGGGVIVPVPVPTPAPVDPCLSNPYYPWIIAMEADASGEEYCNELYPNPGQHTYWYTRTQNGAVFVTTSTVATTTSTRTRTFESTTTVTKFNALINKRASFSGFLAQGNTVVNQVCKCMAQRKKPYTFTHTRTVGAAGRTSTVRVTATRYATTSTTSVTTTTVTLANDSPRAKGRAPGPVIISTTTPTPTQPPPRPRPGAAQCDYSDVPGGQNAGGCTNGCFCDIDADGVYAYCDTAVSGDGLKPCTTDAQCAPAQACMDFLRDGNYKCYTVNTCRSTFIPPLKRNEN